MIKPSKKELAEIKSTLKDNASDMTVYDLFDRVINDWKLTNLFPHDNPEQGDKDLLEKIFGKENKFGQKNKWAMAGASSWNAGRLESGTAVTAPALAN